ncbi:MAG: DUF2232 domain-containing protein [Spirochaetes bacterium]|nr:DUF2232 domain-containing protein [Spirochaetota bacterium]
MEKNDKTIISALLPFILILLSLIFYISPSFMFLFFPLILLFPLALSPLLIGVYKYRAKFLVPLISSAVFFVIFYFIPFFTTKDPKTVRLQESLTLLLPVLYLILCLFPALLYYYSLKKNFTMQKTFHLFFGYIFLIVIGLVVIFKINLFSDQLAYWSRQWGNFTKEYIADLKKLNFSDDFIQNQLFIMNESLKIVKGYFPSLLFMGLTGYFILNIFASTLFISRFITKNMDFLNIFHVKINEHIIWVFIASWALHFLFLNLKLEALSKAGLNLSFIVSILYIFQGLSIFLFRLLISHLSLMFKTVLLFVFFILVSRFLLISSIILMGLGLLDIWFDFRKLKSADEPET